MGWLTSGETGAAITSLAIRAAAGHDPPWLGSIETGHEGCVVRVNLASEAASSGWTLLTPDGTRIVAATPQGITEFSARTGNPILSEDQFRAGWQEVLWAGPGGKALVVSDPRGKPATDPGNVLGVLTGNTFTPIPHGANESIQIAW